ncbi:hypothetical protein [Brevibacterium sp. HMSC22B09]|uniref:hypothetical protein n=1 Tax=Brevibacterium sp. HMSC22B09 TaxID=1581055 RepID=UPI00114CC7BA|nr:hypothetical protein [Brevibacterium sp. HMSC22B09]
MSSGPGGAGERGPGGHEAGGRMPGSRTGTRKILRWVSIAAIAAVVLALVLFTVAGSPQSGVFFFALICAAAAGVLSIWAVIGWAFEFLDRKRASGQ